MKKLYASDLLNKRMDEMHDVIAPNAPRHRTARNHKATLPVLEMLETFTYDNDIVIDVKPNVNLGVIVEATVKAYLNKGDGLAPQGKTDLVTGGKRFDVKLLVKGSTSYPSSIDLDSKDDVLFITNHGVRILRNENLKQAKAEGLLNAKNRFTGKALDSDLLITTAFTERLTTEMGLDLC